jgi:hypothetical protein
VFYNVGGFKMPPVEVLNDKGPRKRLKFIRNTCYEGTDYGPGCEAGDTAEVDSRWAANFVSAGRAVDLEAAQGGPAPGEAQVRDPVAEHRDPQLPGEKKK